MRSFSTSWTAELRSGIKKPLAFLKKDFITAASYKLAFAGEIGGVFLACLVLSFLARLFGDVASPFLQPYGNDYFSFVLIGVAFANYLQVALASFSTVIREAQTLGTLEALLVTQTEIPTIIVSSSLYSFVLTSVRVVVYLLFGALFFELDVGQANVLSAVVILVLTVVVFSAIGIISASFIMVLKKGSPVNWLVNNVSWLLGGVYYPVSVLPDWLQVIAWWLPITHSLEGMRLALIHGRSLVELSANVLSLVGFAVVLMPLSLWTFGWAVRRAKRDGSLTQF